MKLSVVIPTHDRAESLGRTLDALSRQTLPNDAFEIVVVDDGSRPSELSRVRSLGGHHAFALVEQPQAGLAAARNAGAARARGEILWFLDDDVVPSAEAAERHVAAHAASQAPAAVVGSLPYPEGTRLTPFLRYLEHCTHYDLYKDPHKYPGGLPPLPPLNGNSSVSRDTFVRVGRYDESFRQYGGEDLELGYRLAQAGVRFVYEPRAVGYHHHLKDFDRFCKDMERAGESLIRIYRKHPHPEIREGKKIDLVEASFGALPWRKRGVKALMELSLALPWILALPRLVIRAGEGLGLARPLFPLYRWVAHTHYAKGMRRALAGRSHG